MDSKNRVLSIAETAALPDFERVYVEVRGPLTELFSGVHTKYDKQLTDICGAFDIGGMAHASGYFRVWARPRPPSSTELAENNNERWEKGWSECDDRD